MKKFTSSKSVLVPTVVETTPLDWASPQQKEAFEYGPYPLCLSGGYGSAKTWLATMKILYLADLFPGSRWVIGRRRWTELSKTTMQTFFKNCPPQAYQPYGRRSDTEKILQLNNGSMIYWMHLDDPEIATIIQGIEINGFFLDQAEEIPEEIFEKLSSRLGRWDKVEMPQWLLKKHPDWQWTDQQGRPIVPPFAMIACNPDNELHWIYRRFHDDSPEKWQPLSAEIPSYGAQGYHMIHMPSDSNKFLSKVALDQLRSKDESFQKRYRRGEWGIPEGQIHLIPRASLIPGTRTVVEKILRECRIYRAMDHGESSPTACTWFGVDRSGNIFAFQEYYNACPNISIHRERITALSTYKTLGMEMKMEIIRSLADPSIFDQSTGKGGEKWTVAQEYSDGLLYPPETAIWWEPADNNELSTRQRINEYLVVDPERKHPITGELGAPKLFFVVKSPDWPWGLDMVLREMQSQRRERVGMSLGKPIFSDDRAEGIPDHGYDTVRYFVASRPSAPTEAQKSAPRNSFMAIQKEIKDRKMGKISDRIGRVSRTEFLNAKVRRYSRG